MLRVVRGDQKLFFGKGTDMANDYGSLVAKWKSDLILERAHALGVPRREIEDVQQELILNVLNFQYDPERANGATERTALTSLIDNQIYFYMRRDGRRAKHLERYTEYCQGNAQYGVDDSQMKHEEQFELKMDVAVAISRLGKSDRAICQGLASGETPAQIAARLNISRYDLDRRIRGIRDHFSALGLEPAV